MNLKESFKKMKDALYEYGLSRDDLAQLKGKYLLAPSASVANFFTTYIGLKVFKATEAYGPARMLIEEHGIEKGLLLAYQDLFVQTLPFYILPPLILGLEKILKKYGKDVRGTLSSIPLVIITGNAVYYMARDIYHIAAIACEGFLPQPYKQIVSILTSILSTLPFVYLLAKDYFSRKMRGKFKNLYNFFAEVKKDVKEEVEARKHENPI